MQADSFFFAVSIWGKDLYSESSEHALEIKQMLSALGVPIKPLGSPETTHFLSFEHTNQHIDLHSHIPVRNRFLVVSEPPVVRPDEHRKTIKNKYGRVVLVSPAWVTRDHDIYWQPGFIRPNLFSPLTTSRAPLTKSSSIELALINENKFSFVNGNNYTFRQRAISGAAAGRYRLAVAGKNWDRPLRWYVIQQLKALLICVFARGIPDLRHFRLPLRLVNKSAMLLGQVPSAIKFLQKYPVALVIENDSSYLSEKLFHALIAEAAPIYIGPPLKNYGLPETITFQCQPSLDALFDTIEILNTEKIQDCIVRGRELLADPKFNEYWSVASGYKRLAEILRHLLWSD